MLKRTLIVVAVLLSVAGVLAVAAERKPSGDPAVAAVFRAGAYAQDITPVTWPVPVNGNMAVHLSSGANDTLHARCLVLDDGKHKIAFAVVDSCMIYREIMDAAKALASKATGIPTSHMLVSATHAHSCPASVSIFQADADPAYQKFLTQKIAEGIIKAHERLEPAQVGWAVGSDPTQVFNRRWRVRQGQSYTNPFGSDKDRARMNPGYQNPLVTNPAAPVDPEVPVLAVRTAKGKPLAVLANYSLHYVGGVPGGQLSADYFGEFARQLTKKIGGDDDFVAIMSNGTSGDINNVNYAAPPQRHQPFEKIRIVADSVSNAAVKAYQTIAFRDHVTLDMKEREIELAVRKPSTEEVAVAKQVMATGKKRPDGQFSELPAVYARETVLLADFPETKKIKLQAIRIGDLGIVSSPCETFVEIGLELKAKSPLKPTFTIELANGYNGYLPTVEQHALGGYETWRARSSYLEIGAAPKITRTLLELIEEVAR